jgi:hypothetical protein
MVWRLAPSRCVLVASAKLRALAQHLKRAFGDPPYWEEGTN